MFRELTIIFILCSSINIFGQDSKPPNIIMMIGDGMGLSAISSGMYSNNNYTSLERTEYVGLLKTHSLDNLVTDSAASGTAMSSGVKTYNRTVGLDGSLSSVKSILAICRDRGYMTAIIATSTIVHATPASYYSKVKSRYQYDEIASQLSKSNINFFVGGGEKYFNDRLDGRNLINEMDDYFFANSLESFKNINSNKIGYLTYYDEPVGKHEGREPSLEDIAQITIQKLKSFDNPFFLLVEGSQIDWGGHDNDADYLISELIDFDNTIGVVLDFAESNKETLVIVTADHETGGFTLGQENGDYNKIKPVFSTTGHSATMVPVFASGPSAGLFGSIYENTAIYDKMKSLFFKNYKN